MLAVSSLILIAACNQAGEEYDMLVPKIDKAGIAAADVPALMSEYGVEYHRIETVDWPEVQSYLPFVEFAIAHNSSSILIHYRVDELTVRAMAGEDHGHVWEDSCVEFFCVPDSTTHNYYNVECNCIGTLHIAGGAQRKDRVYADAGVMAGVDRWASLGREAFEERPSEGVWEVALVIPVTTFFLDDIKSMDDLTITANFYKCGDALEHPHFVSWAPIDIPKPNFHRPDFFRPIHFE